MNHALVLTRCSALALACLLLAACSSGGDGTPAAPVPTPTPTPAPTPPAVTTPPPAPLPTSPPVAVVPRVVVAVIDSGINPYHSFYYPRVSSVTPVVLQAFNIGESHQITLTRSGDFESDFAADKVIWDQIQKGDLYWFKGTNIIAASFDDTGRKILPDDALDTHGVGTSSAVLAANPEAIVLFAETGETVGQVDAEHLGFLHPLVDIVSTSYGAQVPVAGIGLPIPFVDDSFESVMTLGKLHFSSAANSPDPFTPESGGAGPWWVVSVAGVEEDSSEGRTLFSGFFTDFVSDYSQTLPGCADSLCEDGLIQYQGTSFATPRAAGVASRVLLETRRLLKHAGGITTADGKPVLAAASGRSISNWQLRRALESGAFVEKAAAYRPQAGVAEIAPPAIDAAPWLILGWGDLSAKPDKAVVDQTLAALGFALPTRSKPAGACEFQTAMIERRHRFWDSPVIVSFNAYSPPTDDPFIYCE